MAWYHKAYCCCRRLRLSIVRIYEWVYYFKLHETDLINYILLYMLLSNYFSRRRTPNGTKLSHLFIDLKWFWVQPKQLLHYTNRLQLGNYRKMCEHPFHSSWTMQFLIILLPVWFFFHQPHLMSWSNWKFLFNNNKKYLIIF